MLKRYLCIPLYIIIAQEQPGRNLPPFMAPLLRFPALLSAFMVVLFLMMDVLLWCVSDMQFIILTHPEINVATQGSSQMSPYHRRPGLGKWVTLSNLKVVALMHMTHYEQ